MLLVIPVSKSDEEMIKPFIDCIKSLGSCRRHRLLVVAKQEDTDIATNTYNELKGLFSKKSSMHIFDVDIPVGWPQGPNAYWLQTIKHLQKTDNKEAWLWMEVDCTPLKPKWLDILSREYKKNCKRKPFMGYLHTTTTVTRDEERKLIPIGYHLVGAGIYPHNIEDYCETYNDVCRLNIAFDVLIQWYVAPLAHHTSLYQHNFRTCNYKYDGVDITCDHHTISHPSHTFNVNVDPNAVILHGCKDGSLAEIITAGVWQPEATAV